MALIKKIRERTGIAVGVVAVALMLFILGGDFISKNSFIRGRSSRDVGEIAGKDISYEEYQKEISDLEQRYGGNIQEAQKEGLRQQAWESLIAKTAFEDEFDELGITVPEEEQREMIYGKDVDPSITQAFTNPQTGVFDRKQMEQYLGNTKNLPKEQLKQVQDFLRDVYRARQRLKYENLILNTVYVTAEEAKRDYENQTAKAEVKYLYVPFSTINDSTIKITDDQIKEYISKNKEKYEGDDNASIEYVTFPVVPSKDDSVAIEKEMSDLASEFKTTSDDSTFSKINTEGPFSFNYVNPGELPQTISSRITSLQKGDVVGPILENGSLKLLKLSDVKTDSVYSARASHILFKAVSESPEDLAKTLQQAKDVLKQIKDGASFESMAMIHGTDGTKNQGGDLGWFSKGRMVPEFEKAVFNFNGTGLLPEPVKTQFGYHIIKVTEPKSSLKYRVAIIERLITPGEATSEKAYRKASAFAASSTNEDAYKKNAAKDGLAIMQATRLGKADKSINELANTREIVKWVFNEASVGDVSQVFDLENKHVIVFVKAKYEKGKPNLDNIRDEVSPKIRNEIKGKQIAEKLEGSKGSLEDMAKKYGADANVYTQADITLSSSSLNSVGYAPIATGKVFGMKKGQKSSPIVDESGVLVVEVLNSTPAPAIADYSMYKDQIAQRRKSQAGYGISEAVKKFANIKDERTKFF